MPENGSAGYGRGPRAARSRRTPKPRSRPVAEAESCGIGKPWKEPALPPHPQQTPSAPGAAAPANWEALINGQRLLLTQVVFLPVKAAGFMELSLIKL